MRPGFCAHTPTEGSSLWHLLKDHLNEVARLAQAFGEEMGVGPLAKYAGLWHDLGKYNPDFQKYLEDCNKASVAGDNKKRRGPPHSVQGAILAENECPFLAPIIYGHHAGLSNYDDIDLENARGFDTYQQTVENASNEITGLYPTEDLEGCFEKFPDDKLVEEVLCRFVFSCLIDADRLDTEKHFEEANSESRDSFKRPPIAELSNSFNQKHQSFLNKLQKSGKADSAVNRLRAEVFDHCLLAAANRPGVFRLAVPTGGGKTLSGLAFALNHILANQESGLRRVVVAVPYTSIIEQTAKVYRGILGDAAVLEHHSAVTVESLTAKGETGAFDQMSEGAQRDQAQARLVTQNWDAPLILTTTVQLFESLFSNNPSKCRKLHNLVGSVIILDEVQTLPVMYLQPIVSMLKELVERYKVSVLLCTATQPAWDSTSGYFQGFDAKLVRDVVPVERSRQLFQQLKRVTYNVDSSF
jgi:CRISPR-associated endonuclease/helicase Cas3